MYTVSHKEKAVLTARHEFTPESSEAIGVNFLSQGKQTPVVRQDLNPVTIGAGIDMNK